MIEQLKFIPKKAKRLHSLLGLALDGSRLEGVVLKRTEGSLRVEETFSVGLTLDPLTADPELIGREIRNHLDAAEVRERDCVVALPLKWALTAHAEVPELPEADIESFLKIEAERGFASDIDTLLVSTSRCKLPSGKQEALMVGIPRSHLELIERALRSAKLKPISFSLGVTALQSPGSETSKGIMALAIGESHVGLQITYGNAIAAMRALEGAVEVEGSRRKLHADLVAREARITLGQLPAELRDAVRLVRIFGPRELAQQLADEMELRLDSMGLKIELVTRYTPAEFGLQIPPETPVSPSLSLAASRLAGRKAPFEFLPPRLSAWQQLGTRYASGKFRTIGLVGGSIVGLALIGFLFQQWQLVKYRSQWNKMAVQVKELSALQDQIIQYRPWFDNSFRALTIMKQLATAFPEDGVVTAKTLEIRDLNTVTCTGTTRDNKALIEALGRLRTNENVSAVRVTSIRGSKPPLQFSFDFHWNNGGKNEN
jgi:hypothetical protein